MRVNKIRWISIFASGMIFTASGCGLTSGGPSRTSDGGGGNLLTAGFKAVSGQLGQLTQDEIQQLSDAGKQLAIAVDPTAADLPDMTNDQADGFLDFLHANNVNSLEDSANLATNAANDPSILVVPPSLVMAYAGTGMDFDEENFDVDAFFAMVFGS